MDLNSCLLNEVKSFTNYENEIGRIASGFPPTVPIIINLSGDTTAIKNFIDKIAWITPYYPFDSPIIRSKEIKGRLFVLNGNNSLSKYFKEKGGSTICIHNYRHVVQHDYEIISNGDGTFFISDGTGYLLGML